MTPPVVREPHHPEGNRRAEFAEVTLCVPLPAPSRLPGGGQAAPVWRALRVEPAELAIVLAQLFQDRLAQGDAVKS